MAKNVIFSIIRTVVPALVTMLLALVTKGFGPIIDADQAQWLNEVALTGAYALYYILARLAEEHISPKFSVLLGDFRSGATAPVYPETETVVVPSAGAMAEGAKVENLGTSPATATLRTKGTT